MQGFPFPLDHFEEIRFLADLTIFLETPAMNTCFCLSEPIQHSPSTPNASLWKSTTRLAAFLCHVVGLVGTTGWKINRGQWPVKGDKLNRNMLGCLVMAKRKCGQERRNKIRGRNAQVIDSRQGRWLYMRSAGRAPAILDPWSRHQHFAWDPIPSQRWQNERLRVKSRVVECHKSVR